MGVYCKLIPWGPRGLPAEMLAWLSLKSVSTLIVGGAYGGMVFFSFAVAPQLFSQLGRETAGRFVRVFFPQYYLVMALACVAGAGLLAILQRFPVEVAVLAAVAFAFIVLRRGLQPRLEALRERRAQGDAAAEARFRQLHGTSMIVNLVQILAVGFVLLRLGA